MFRVIALLLLVLCSIAASEPVQGSFFELCSHDYYNRDKVNKCKLKSYTFNEKIPRLKEFISCVFWGYRWVPEDGPRKVQTAKMLSDLKAIGMTNVNDAQKVVTNCEKKIGGNIAPVDYFLCLHKNPKTKEGLLKWLKAKDGPFFQKC